MLRNCLEEDMCLYRPNGSQKGVKFIDNFNLFRGHRQLFKLDGLHSNKLDAKDNIYFSLRHPSVVCADPLRLNGTHTPGQNMSDHRTSYHLPSPMWLTYPTRTLIMSNSQNKLSSWKLSRLSPQSSTQTDCYNLLLLQKLQDSAHKDEPGQHTGNTRGRAHLTRYIIPLSSISTTKLLTEIGGTGVCWDQTLPLFRCKPPYIN